MENLVTTWPSTSVFIRGSWLRLIRVHTAWPVFASDGHYDPTWRDLCAKSVRTSLWESTTNFDCILKTAVCLCDSFHRCMKCTFDDCSQSALYYIKETCCSRVILISTCMFIKSKYMSFCYAGHVYYLKLSVVRGSGAFLSPRCLILWIAVLH